MDFSDTIPIDSSEAQASDVGLHAAFLLTVRTLRDRCDRGDLVVHVPPAVRLYRFDPIPHLHPHVECFLQASGGGIMALAEGSLTYRPGQMIVVPPGVAHLEHPDPRIGPFWNFVYVPQSRALSMHLTGPAREGHRIRRRLVWSTTESGRLAGYLHEAIVAVQAGRAGDHPLVRGLILAHLALLADVVEGQVVAPAREDALVTRAKALVAQYLSDHRLGVAWVADQLGCSSDHLSRRFHAETGATLVATIVRERLGLARGLLADRGLGVAEVARACGIRDPAYFSRCFARETGLSPRAWRARQG